MQESVWDPLQARRGGEGQERVAHTFLPVTPRGRSPGTDRSVQAAPRDSPSSLAKVGGGADSPPGKGRAHLAGISSFISSPINSQIGCHHRLSIHHLRWRLGANTSSKYLAHPKEHPEYPPDSNSSKTSCVTPLTQPITPTGCKVDKWSHLCHQ